MTTPYYTDERAVLHHGDCLDVLAAMPDASVDAIVTDPPYGLEFMGKEWDAPWKASGVGRGVRVATERADEMTPTGGGHTTSAGPYLAARVDSVRVAGLPFQQWCELWARECLRVLKPGGHLLAFGGTRTWHRLAVAIEDAGFELRDSIAWIYGSGFPKSLNVATAIDRHREGGPTIVRGPEDFSRELLPDEARFCAWMRDESGLTEIDARRLLGSARFITGEVQVVNTATKDAPRWGRRAMVPTAAAWEKLRPTLATEPPEWVEALVKRPPEPEGDVPGDVWTPGRGQGSAGCNEWAGWGTALKPSHEPVVVARKPLEGTVASNVLAHGTGALNIDACRVGTDDSLGRPHGTMPQPMDWGNRSSAAPFITEGRPAGRWPANVVLDEHAAAELDRQSGESSSRVGKPRGAAHGEGWGMTTTGAEYADTGGASRFFYVAKAPTSERPRYNKSVLRLRAGLTPEQVGHVRARLAEAGVRVD